MRRFTFSASCIGIVCLALLSACSMQPTEPDRELQRAALERWSQCLERFAEGYEDSVNALRYSANSVCDGHRRDVLATFPPHLENQVDTILSDRTRVFTSRLMKTGLGNAPLREAGQDDL